MPATDTISTRRKSGRHKPDGQSQQVQVFCPACGFANLFWGKTTSDGEVIEHYGRRCQGWHEDERGERQQCDYRFCFKLCADCGAQNDIAARHCHHCQRILLDPDDMLKAALRLKDALVLRCSGMSLRAGQDDKGEWLQVTYYDEDGADVGELYRLHTPAQRRLFALRFLPLHLRPPPGVAFTLGRAKDIEAAADKLRAPDFVVSRLRG